MSATSFQNQYDKIKQEHPEWLEPVSEHKWAEAGKQASEAFKKLKEMEEKEFIWTDKSVAEACYWIGLKINGTEDIQKQIPPLIEKYKENKNREQQKQYPDSIMTFCESGNNNYVYDRTCVHHDNYNAWVKHHLEKNHKISSVQNGNEVLTVGDTVKFRYGEEFKIETFKIRDGAIFACTENETIRYLVHPNNLRKIVPPLFQISWKDITEGTEIFILTLSTWNIIKHIANKFWDIVKDPEYDKAFKIFLTREEAENYVEENRPQYSKAQMRNAFEESRLTHPMAGFKHDTFEDYEKYLTLLKNKTK